jgi:Ca-activated chloride channel family protein
MFARSMTFTSIVAGAGLSFLLFASDSDYVIHSDVPLVLLDVSVRDRAGGFVSGLKKENFHVFENGHPQQLTAFAGEDVPVTVGILVDESFSMTPKRAQALTAAMAFIGESNPHDEVFVMHFNDSLKFGLPNNIAFSDDRRQLRDALFGQVPQGKTALYDAVSAGIDHLALGRRDKKTLIVISDGGDNASNITRQEMLSKVERSLATIYTIGLFDEDAPDRDPAILRRLSKISGGVAYFPPQPSEMVGVCRRIAKDIRARYTIGYAPSAGTNANGKDTWRHIRVDVSAPGHGKLIARTRTGYRYAAGGEQ